MNLRVIITFFAAAVMLFSGFPLSGISQGRAEETVEPATHLWLYSSPSTMYVPAATKQGCEILVQQVSMLNSATGHCYLKEQFLEEIKCTKSLQQGGTPSCTMSAQSTR